MENIGLYFGVCQEYNLIYKGEVNLKFINQRGIQILELLKKSDRPMTSSQIAVLMEISSRTVRNEIKEINQILEKYGAKIISKNGLGFVLTIYDENKFQEFLKEFVQTGIKKLNIIPSNPQDRVGYIISRILHTSLKVGEKIEWYDLEEELHIGSTTLRNDFNTVREVLSRYELKISITKKHGIRIIGEEAGIRYCISEYAFNNSSVISLENSPIYGQLFYETEVQKIREILKQAISDYDLKLTDLAFKNLLIHILIMMKRYAKACVVLYQPDTIEAFKERKEYLCAKEIAKKIKEEMQEDIGVEVYYITQHLMSSQRFLEENSGSRYRYQGTQNILETIHEQTGIDLTDDEGLITGLDTHLSIALQRLKFNMNIRNEVLDLIKSCYPLAFELAVLAGGVIEKEFNLQMKENELGFMAVHFAAALGRKGISNEEESKSAVIVCDAGRSIAVLIKEKINQLFSDRIKIIGVYRTSDLTNKMIDSVDLVIATVDIAAFHSEKIVNVKVFFEEDDVRKISYALKHKNSMENLKYKSVFRKDLFFTGLNLKTKDEVLTYLTDVLMEKGYITENVKQSIFKREELATTEIGCLMAIPHALLNDMEDVTVAVAILKKPIVWDKEKVQVVLMLNIPKNKNSVWEGIFKKVYRELISEQGVTWLIKNQDYEEFIEKIEHD